MLETIMSLVGGGLGGLLRFAPEVLKFFSAKGDRAHEYKMTDLQLKIDRARSDQQIDFVHARGDVNNSNTQMQVYLEAIKGQSVMSGIKWLDGLNQSVRPIITYWWMALLTAYKSVTIYAACQDFTNLSTFSDAIWTPNDAATLSMIIGFWFVDRSIKRMGR